MSAKITILGFYKWMQAENKDLFSNLSMPDGIDKDTLVENILIKAGDFEVLYSDPDFMMGAIGTWSRKWNRTFKKWVNALNIDYEPLNNYDRTEEWETTDDGSTTGSGSSTGKISAYNSDTMRDNTSATSSSSGTAKNTNIRKGRAYGNIGVTTSQQMLQAELDLASWNLYEHITDIFLSEFIIPVF